MILSVILVLGLFVISGCSLLGIGDDAVGSKIQNGEKVLLEEVILKNNYDFVPVGDASETITEEGKISIQVYQLTPKNGVGIDKTSFTICSSSCSGGCPISGCDPVGTGCSGCSCYGSEECTEASCNCVESSKIVRPTNN